LDPSEQGQKRENLGLDLEGEVEGGGNVVDAEGDACPGPEHHHGRLKTGGIVAAVVYDDLRY
jgi:hypothetical protein